MNYEAARDLIITAVTAIPVGSVMSYGAVAERAGLPRRARLVARVLSNLPGDGGVPWFRVVRAGNRIAFAPGSESFGRQREHLQAEGCQVSDSGLVRAARVRVATLDSEIWGAFFGVDH